MATKSPEKSEAKGKKSKVAALPARGLKAGEASKVKGGVENHNSSRSNRTTY